MVETIWTSQNYHTFRKYRYKTQHVQKNPKQYARRPKTTVPFPCYGFKKPV